MFDMYTFDANKDDATTTYHKVYRAYHNIFKRIGVNVVQVEADTGKIGGTLSHEFQLLSEGFPFLFDPCQDAWVYDFVIPIF